MKNKSLTLIIGAIVVIVILFLFLGLGHKAAKKSSDNNQSIVIPIHNWSSQIVMAHVIGGIFESMGKNVKYVQADPQEVYELIRIGEITISHEVWELTYGKSFDTARDKGGVLDWGDHKARTIEDMGYPNWAAKYCPGLPDWKALKNPDCAKAFATPDTDGKGLILEAPQSWHGDLIPERIEALGLADLWTIQFAYKVDDLWEEIKRATTEDRGVIIFNWTPNFTDKKGFTFIDFPPYYNGCRLEDGGDSKCGSPKGYLKKAVNDNFPKAHPAAAAMFKKLSFNTNQIGAMAALIDEDKMSYEDAAKKWLEDSKKVWEKWIK